MYEITAMQEPLKDLIMQWEDMVTRGGVGNGKGEWRVEYMSGVQLARCEIMKQSTLDWTPECANTTLGTVVSAVHRLLAVWLPLVR